MNILNCIWLTIIKFVKKIALLPRTIGIVRKQQRQRQAALNEYEFDRIDRLRNPSNYRGK